MENIFMIGSFFKLQLALWTGFFIQDTLPSDSRSSDVVLVDTLAALLPQGFDYEGFYQENGRGGISLRDLQNRIEIVVSRDFSPLIFSTDQIEQLTRIYDEAYAVDGGEFVRNQEFYQNLRVFQEDQERIHNEYLILLAGKVGLQPLHSSNSSEFADVYTGQFARLQESFNSLNLGEIVLDQEREQVLQKLLNSDFNAGDELNQFRESVDELYQSISLLTPTEISVSTQVTLLRISLRCLSDIVESQYQAIEGLVAQNQLTLEINRKEISDVFGSNDFRNAVYRSKSGLDAIKELRQNHEKYKRLSSLINIMALDIDEFIVDQGIYKEQVAPMLSSLQQHSMLMVDKQNELIELLSFFWSASAKGRENFKTMVGEKYMLDLIENSTQTEEFRKIVSQRNLISSLSVVIAALILAVLGVVLWLFRQKIASNKEIAEVVNAGGQMLADICSSQEKINRIWKSHKIAYYLKDKFAIGGDFFWVHENQRFRYLMIGDSEGHGMQGGIVTAYSVGILNSLIRHHEKEGKLLGGKSLLQNFTSTVEEMNKSWFTDFGLLVNDRKLGTHVYYGTLPLYYSLKDELIEVKTGAKNLGLAVGFQEGNSIKHKEKVLTGTALNLPKGANILIASDGYPTQAVNFDNNKMKTLGKKKFKSLLANGLEKSTPKHVKTYLVQKLEEMVKKSKTRTDDHSFVCLQLN